MNRTAEGELLYSIYLLTPWDFEGLVEGVLTFSRLIFIPHAADGRRAPLGRKPSLGCDGEAIDLCGRGACS